MRILTSAAVCFTAVVLASCVDPNYYPPPSNDFRPYGPQADRFRDEGSLPRERDRDDTYGRRNPYEQRDQRDRRERYDLPREPPADPVPRRDEYPEATRTANPNQVLSPYQPYNVIDIEGFRSGQLAKDPSNDKIFRIP